MSRHLPPKALWSRRGKKKYIKIQPSTRSVPPLLPPLRFLCLLYLPHGRPSNSNPGRLLFPRCDRLSFVGGYFFEVGGPALLNLTLGAPVLAPAHGPLDLRRLGACPFNAGVVSEFCGKLSPTHCVITPGRQGGVAPPVTFPYSSPTMYVLQLHPFGHQPHGSLPMNNVLHTGHRYNHTLHSYLQDFCFPAVRAPVILRFI